MNGNDYGMYSYQPYEESDTKVATGGPQAKPRTADEIQM